MSLDAYKATTIILPGEPEQEITADLMLRWLESHATPNDEAAKTVAALCDVVRDLRRDLARARQLLDATCFALVKKL